MSLIIRQYGDDTSVTDSNTCFLTLVSPLNSQVRLATPVATNGSGQFHVKSTFVVPGEGGNVNVAIRTFGAIFNRGIIP